ncbi:MAG: hypothetical protein BWY00_01738 [Firmicutes bacterium ADurb.Bin153]|nr:MAG: hypothetical protein BWY00_01738 [Firmicutes bacterium ADurb.Bin153]
MNLATTTNPNWESRSVDTYIEWHGVQVNVIGTESWLPGTNEHGIDVEAVLCVQDVKGRPVVVDITELVTNLDGLEALEERLGIPKKPKHVPVCYRLACPDRTFLKVDPMTAQQDVGPMARKVG